MCAVVVLRRSVGERGAGARAGVCGVCTTLTEENAALTFYFQSVGGRARMLWWYRWLIRFARE
jgi:hypothetical protein